MKPKTKFPHGYQIYISRYFYIGEIETVTYVRVHPFYIYIITDTIECNHITSYSRVKSIIICIHLLTICE